MTLDCEYMQSERAFVVFDVLALDRQQLQSTYSQRLSALAELPLPVLSGFAVTVKTVYPLCVLTPAWYAAVTEADDKQVDGLIVHDGASALHRASTMYKWKPVHTVDLLSSGNNTLVNSNSMPFLTPDPDSGVRKKGQIWECAIVGKYVSPLRLRTDKKRANAPHVCHEILKAHRDNLSLEDVARVLSRADKPVRQSKRRRTNNARATA